MNSDSDGPKRHETHPTVPIPRDQLPPISSPVIPASERVTMCECPCGRGMITVDEAMDWIVRMERDEPK